MPQSLFLDANVYLSFFSFGKDDIEELAKLLHLINGEDIKLYTNNQLRDEIYRNREKKIAEAKGNLASFSFGREFPNFFKGYSELTLLAENLSAARKTYQTLSAKVDEDIKSNSLPADLLIKQLLDAGNCTTVTEEIYVKAERRVMLGNPPGKRGSLGDALHWECLLQDVADYTLHLVTSDNDFFSALDASNMADYLFREWQIRRKHGKIEIFRSLSDYLLKHHPGITLSQEADKDALVDRLGVAASFSETHEIISGLSRYRRFTLKQTRKLFQALLNNNQVRWIATDEDIRQFFSQFETVAFQLDNVDCEEAEKLLEFSDGFFSIPF